MPILATKLFIPPPQPKIVPRPRLVERLNEGFSANRKLALISAPAGFGKTTLVSEWVAGCGLPVAWLSLDERFRMVVNEVEVVPTDAPLPRLPVARALWVPKPNLKVGATAWILAGGAHHTGFSQALTAAHMRDFADVADMEFLLIDTDTKIADFKNEIRWNEVYYLLSQGL
jgi:L-arabinose isomerase